ncbi:MAG: hypothetical protein KBD00_00335 [Candidatus Peribacteraceae bacterium]|nr:hypothetical protein [Candidatus Peribacteraceae bacterium]
MDSILGKIAVVNYNKYWKEVEKKTSEFLEKSMQPQISEFVRLAISRVLMFPDPRVSVQELIAIEKKLPERKTNEVQERIEILQRLFVTLGKKWLKDTLSSAVEAGSENPNGNGIEEIIFEWWQSEWSEFKAKAAAKKSQSLYTAETYRDTVARINQQPEMPDEFEDPEEFKAFEHASACECGYACEKINRSSKNDQVSLSELQEIQCRPVDIIERVTYYNFGNRENKCILEATIRSIAQKENHPWKILRTIVEDSMTTCIDEIEEIIRNPIPSEIDVKQIHATKTKIDAVRYEFILLDRFAMRLPFVSESESVRRFSKIYEAAAVGIEKALSILESRLQFKLRQEKQKIEDALKEYGILLDGDENERDQLYESDILRLQKILSDTQLLAGLKKCNSPRDYVAFFDDIGVPDTKWRNYDWMMYRARLPKAEGGIDRDLSIIVKTIRQDERFSPYSSFLHWMDTAKIPQKYIRKKVKLLKTPEDFLEWFRDLEIPDNAWRNASWWLEKAKLPKDQGGVGEDLASQYRAIVLRFKSFPFFVASIDGHLPMEGITSPEQVHGILCSEIRRLRKLGDWIVTDSEDQEISQKEYEEIASKKYYKTNPVVRSVADYLQNKSSNNNHQS